MFVEVVRLFIVAGCGTLGYVIGQRFVTPETTGSTAHLIGLLIGIGTGYVLGGIIGRLIERAMGAVEKSVERTKPATLFSGVLGALIGAAAALLFCTPVFFFTDWYVAVPAAALAMWILGTFGHRIAIRRSEDLLAMAGLSSRPLVKATRFTSDLDPDALILDTSALIDGRLLDVVRSGFLRGNVLVPRFVLSELQGIADSGEGTRRRRGRRGLEVLSALEETPRIAVHVLDDDVPEHEHVDAKLVALAKRLRVGLVTTDSNLQRVAELQGIMVLNLNRLASALRQPHSAGDIFKVSIIRAGDQPGQGVGYLDDGTMVVVEGAQKAIGEDVEVQVTSSTQTSVGRMLFAGIRPKLGYDEDGRSSLETVVGNPPTAGPADAAPGESEEEAPETEGQAMPARPITSDDLLAAGGDEPGGNVRRFPRAT